MAGHWSREDLLRAFDLLTKAEQEIRVSDQPRYNLEMALLRLMHLRKLVPLSDLLAGGARTGRAGATHVPPVPNVAKGVQRCQRATFSKAVPAVPPRSAHRLEPRTPSRTTPLEPLEPLEPLAPGSSRRRFKDAFLGRAESPRSRRSTTSSSRRRFGSTRPGRVSSFVFLPNQKNAKSQCDEQKAWLQAIAEKVAGQPVPVTDRRGRRRHAVRAGLRVRR